MREFRAAGLCYSTWVGTLDEAHVPETVQNKGPAYEPLPWAYDDRNIPWFTLWEYSWLLANSGLLDIAPTRVLSLGGNASILEATIARCGHDVTVVDRREYALAIAGRNARRLGYRLRTCPGDFVALAELLGVEEPFTHVVSTSVLFLCGQQARDVVGRQLWRFVVEGGLLAFTFDYANPNPKRWLVDPIGHFAFDNFTVVPPSSAFQDAGERHHLYYPDPLKGYYTAGALFMRRGAV